MSSISKKWAIGWSIVYSHVRRKACILPRPRHCLTFSLFCLTHHLKVLVTAQTKMARLQGSHPIIYTCWSVRRGKRRRLDQEETSPWISPWPVFRIHLDSEAEMEVFSCWVPNPHLFLLQSKHLHLCLGYLTLAKFLVFVLHLCLSQFLLWECVDFYTQDNQ